MVVSEPVGPGGSGGAPASSRVVRGSPSSAREHIEDLERVSLSTWATLAAESKGRDRPEEPDPLRTAFQVDRDRLLGSPVVLRLAGRSWGAGRSVLDHTLEVVVVARTIGRALRLNEDLIEAIALAHGVGTPPFGLAGEAALSGIAGEDFDRAEHALRVVEGVGATSGLNLTWEVRDGIVGHGWATVPGPATPEGQVVRAAVRITDVLARLVAVRRAGALRDADVPASLRRTVREAPAQWPVVLAGRLVDVATERPDIVMPSDVVDLVDQMDALVSSIDDPSGLDAAERAVHCVRCLAVWHLETGGRDLLPAERGTSLEQRVVDTLAGLTDAEAVAAFTERFVPRT